MLSRIISPAGENHANIYNTSARCWSTNDVLVIRSSVDLLNLGLFSQFWHVLVGKHKSQKALHRRDLPSCTDSVKDLFTSCVSVGARLKLTFCDRGNI
eukprot:4558953-Amphidinium_carterae.1